MIGRDRTLYLEVQKYLHKLGFATIVLEDQPNLGRTVIEKFEANANVKYAIVLMTADDEGRLKGTSDLKPRARQECCSRTRLLPREAWEKSRRCDLRNRC